MKKKLFKWTKRVFATVILIMIVLITIILKPILTYANSTSYSNYTIYHFNAIDPAFFVHLESANVLIKNCEWYTLIKTEICLNDGSKYPDLVKMIRGRAFAWGFYDKIVFQGNANYKNNFIELDGYRWNFSQLLAHELVHCLQYEKLGFWNSNPIAGVPEWKWEGYPEYIARQEPNQKDLKNNIERLLQAERFENDGWILFSDGTGTVLPYFKSWLLVQYCIDVRKMTYDQILNNYVEEKQVFDEMMSWYSSNKK